MGCAPSSVDAGGRRRSCCNGSRRKTFGRRERLRLGGVSLDERPEDGDATGRKEFYLPNTGLKFSRRQMERLDFSFTMLAAAVLNGGGNNGDWDGGGGAADACASAMAEASVERLVQRLACAIGMLDPRFASKFLVSLNEPERQRRRKSAVCHLKYLMRVDAISTPELYPEEEDGEERGERPTCILLEGGFGEGVDEGTGTRRMPVTPQGFARVRLQGEGVETWAEFIGQDGYLRSDKMQEHFVSLLSRAASLEAVSTVVPASTKKESFPPPPPPPPPPPFSPSEVDESLYCGSPGKVINPWTLHHILKDLSPSEQLYFGPAKVNQNRFPDPRDFHITIAQKSPHIDLLISPLSPSIFSSKTQCSGDSEIDSKGKKHHNDSEPFTLRQTIKVSLFVGIGFDSWPQTADFPMRIPLGHINALHYYQSALGGFYLLPAKPHHTLRCESPRSSVWLMASPAMELALLSHWCLNQSSPGRSLVALEALLDGIQGRGPGRKLLGGIVSPDKEKEIVLRRVTEDLLHTIHLLHLEKETRGVTKAGSIGGSSDSSWNSPGTSVSMQTLLVLDSIVGALRTQRQRHFMFPRCNVVLLQIQPVQETRRKESQVWSGRNRRIRPMPESLSPNRVSTLWQNALIMSGTFGAEDSSSDSDDEDVFEEEEFLQDASHIESAVNYLHLLSSPLNEPLEEDKDGEGAEDYQRQIEVEIALSRKWQATLLGLVATPLRDTSLTSVPSPTPTPASLLSSRYLSSLPASAYSTRQLKYIKEVLRQRLMVKQITNQEQQSVTHGVGALPSEGPVEELVYTLSSILDPFHSNLDGLSFCSTKKGPSQHRWWRRRSSRLKNAQGMKRWKGNRNLLSIGKSKDVDEEVLGKCSEVPYFPGKRIVINKTLNAMVHDLDTLDAELSDDNSFVYYLLKWLIRAKKEEEKLVHSSNRHHGQDSGCVWRRNSRNISHLTCIRGKRKRKEGHLISYLSMLYASSLENGIHLEEYLRYEEEKRQEIMTFGMWCEMVIEGKIFPDEGVYDAQGKGWKWAQSVLETAKTMACSESPQLIITPKLGVSLRQSFSGPHSKNVLSHSYDQLNCCSSLSLPRTRAGATLPNRGQAAKAKEFLTLHLQRGKFPQIQFGTGNRPMHCFLRDSNPITKLMEMAHRRGMYRGLGTPVSALIAMHKFSVLQEISGLLPEYERQQVLDSIHRVSKVTRRRCRPQRRLLNTKEIGYGKFRMKNSEVEKVQGTISKEKNLNHFGTVNGSHESKTKSVQSGVFEGQHLDDTDEKVRNVKESLQYLCREIMGQQFIKGTHEIGTAHGVKNIAVLSCGLSSDNRIDLLDDAKGRYNNVDKDGNRKSRREMITKL